MLTRIISWTALACAGLSFIAAGQQTQGQNPTCDQVFKDIESFKGVPAKDLIPAMQFMAASLHAKCTFCHDPKDYAAPHKNKNVTRKMITMQRDINAKYFNNRLEVTCNSCHGGEEHPAGTPIPAQVNMRHARLENPPTPQDVLQKHLQAVGKAPPLLTFTGTQTAPSEGEKPTTEAVEYTVAADGRFLVASPSAKFGFDGKQVWRDAFPLMDEPAAVFSRIGRPWRGDNAFAGLDRLSIAGKEKLGKMDTIVVRGLRSGTGSNEELYFDARTGLLARFVSVTRSTIGMVISVYDYSNYKSVVGAKVPMKVDITFSGDEVWQMSFKSAKASETVDDSVFALKSGN